MDEDGFVSIMARSDDVINVAGHRISTKALEEVKGKMFVLFWGMCYGTYRDLVHLYVGRLQLLWTMKLHFMD